MWTTIQTFVEWAAATKTDETTLFGRLETVAADLGYPFWAFGALWGDPSAYGGHPAPAVRLNYPPAWVEHYFAEGFDKIDPVVLLSPYAQTSVTWDKLRPDRPDFFDAAAQHGLRSGISMPLRAINGCYVLCLATDKAVTITLPERARLEVLAAGFFAAYLRVRELEPVKHGLSDNTVEVIRLAMAGLAVPDIAERLKLSKAGVYWCLSDAKEKLGCSNQAQLFLKAIQQGIVAI